MELSLYDVIFTILEYLSLEFWNQSNEYKISKNILKMLYPIFFKQLLTKKYYYYNFLNFFEIDLFLTNF
jgi:hypothetical protein